MFKHLQLHTHLPYHSLGTRSVSSVQIWSQTSFSLRNTYTKNHLDRKRKKDVLFVPDGARPERLMVHDAARGWKKNVRSKFLKYNFLGYIIVLVQFKITHGCEACWRTILLILKGKLLQYIVFYYKDVASIWIAVPETKFIVLMLN